jgi:serine/threonine protein kinase
MAPPHDSAPDPPRDSQTDANPAELPWARVKAVFLDALERPDSERAAFVGDACAGDPRLRDEVQALLESEAGVPLARPRLQPGTRLGSYEIGDFIAAGGMGEVYRARHTLLGRDVAIKTLVGATSDAAARRRLIREAKHASVLSHTNICTIYEVGDGADGPFIVMQHVDGRTLRAIIHEGLPSVDAALAYAMQIADALDHAHAHGIIHRDLKSSNVVVTADERPIVLDFGLARRLPTASAPQSAEPTVTAHDRLAGTLSHMAPEVLLGASADVRSDVWALGVLLYELVTGELPFTGRTPYERARRSSVRRRDRWAVAFRSHSASSSSAASRRSRTVVINTPATYEPRWTQSSADMPGR